MKPAIVRPPQELEPYVNQVMLAESKSPDRHMNMPLYADGYPGIMFQQAQNGFYLLPRSKKLSELFLYGQTLDPISLDVKGPFRYIVFQLYPFASQYLLGVNPRVLNDDCYDLLQVKSIPIRHIYERLVAMVSLEDGISILSDMVLKLIKAHEVPEDDRIQKAISIIVENKGLTSIKEVREQVYVTERTLERQFISQVGLSPKQFAKIIQFQTSLKQLNDQNYSHLLEVGLDSGFSDQSHFIRAFKKYTGQTPAYFIKNSWP